MSDAFSLMPDTPPALLANIMSTIPIIQKKASLFGDLDVPKNAKYSDQLE
jgi:hypothetical protein